MRDAFHCDCLNPDGFVATVDCTKTLAELLSAGDFREIPDLDPFRFAVTPGPRRDVRMGLLHVFKDSIYEEIVAACAERKVKAARPEELLAFGARYPDHQRRNFVLALGVIDVDPVWPSSATAIGLSGDGDGRYVETTYLENGIPAGTHVLFVY